MKLFGGKRKRGDERPRPRTRERKAKGPRQAELPTVQLDSPPPPAVDTAMATHIGTRAYQQDAAFVSPPTVDSEELAFAVLCDGMGGMEDGEAASSETVSFMANAISALPAGCAVPAALTQAVHQANAMLLDYNSRNETEAGTTLCAVLIRAGQLYWASVGDSRIYIVRGGEMARLTRDHNYAIHLQRMVDSGQITQQQADSDPRREALISYIGAPELEELDGNQSPFPLQGGDLLLLCSDGLTKCLSDDEILRHLAAGAGHLQQAANLLTGAAFERGGGAQDNTTVILMRYHAPAATPQQQDECPTQQTLRSEEHEPGEM